MATRRPRGRPRAFDAGDVLDQAMSIFWRQGFTGTTTRALEEEIGLSQSSLYNAFGSKEALFERVLEQYQQVMTTTVLDKLTGPDPNRESILEFIDAIIEWIRHDEHRGCLVLNMSLEGAAGSRRVKAYRSTLRRRLKPAIRTFTADGGAVDTRADLLIVAIFGLNISARGNASMAEIRSLGNSIKTQVEAWA